jgi:glutaminase
MDELSIADILAEVAVLVKPYFGRGRTADYIPELADVTPTKFGMAVRTIGGQEAVIGDADEGFSVQSITKVFSLGLALNRFGDEVWTRVGKEPSGTPFNHLSQLESEEGVPRNPFINAGAIAICDQLMDVFKDPPALVRGFAGFLAGEKVEIDEAVAASELANAWQNRAIANLMRGKGTITSRPRGRGRRLLPPVRPDHELSPTGPRHAAPGGRRLLADRRGDDLPRASDPSPERPAADLRDL